MRSARTRRSDSTEPELEASVSILDRRATEGGYIPHEAMNRGSVSLTAGKRRIFPRYTRCDTILNTESVKGRPSITHRRAWNAMME